tara:strand:- start:1126 stop:1557 length:432 start_codon:yes stop_codon:yes gene_type:complete
MLREFVKTQLPGSLHLPRLITPKALLNLLLLIMAIQPVLAFGQFTADRAEPPARFGQMAMVDCWGASTDGLSEQDMACGDMASTDCAIAANQGSCGAMLSALVSEKAALPVQCSSDPTPLRPREVYLSVILDTLTPPPDFSVV